MKPAFGSPALFLLACAVASSQAAIDVLGVAKQDLSKYQPDENGKWACLNHPEIVLSYTQINDDICDCPDGSDEPGTAACPGNWFHCRNEGHIPGKLPSSRVNDGVCDYEVCCDGSDEAGLQKLGLTPKCENKCAQMHKEYLAKKQARDALLKAASENRQKLVNQAAALREGLQKEIASKEKKVEGLRTLLAEAEAVLQDLEAKEAARAPPKPQVIDDAQASMEFLLGEYQKSQNELTSLAGQVATLSALLEQMKVDYNPNFNDPAVKHAIRSFEEFRGNLESKPPVAPDAEKFGAIPNVIDALKAYTPPVQQQPQQQWNLDFQPSTILKNIRRLLIDYSILPDNGDTPSPEEPEINVSNTESAALKKQRTSVAGTKGSLSDVERQLQDARNSLATEHGPEDILRSLKDICVSSNLGEYVYEFCFYGSASQKSTKDSSSVNLGKFENASVDTKSEDGALILNFEKGAKCWSGPIRRATVSLECGKDNTLIQVTEPERCEYFIRGTSPAACAQYNPEGAAKDEL